MTGWWLAGSALGATLEEGRAAMAAGQFELAHGVLGAVVAAEPANVDAWWELGWADWSRGGPAASLRSWQEVAKLDPHHPELAMWLQSAAARAAIVAAPVPTDPVATAPTPGRIRFVAGGDVMMGSDLRKGPAGLAPGNGEVLFDGVRALFQGADVAFLNLEGPLADDLPSNKCAPGSTSCYAFRTPTRYGAALTSIGLDLASIANNHAFDLGPEGQESTMALLDRLQIGHAGRWGDVAYVERGGVTIALVAAHSGVCCLDVNGLEEVKKQVGLADARADLVVFSYHGGKEGAEARHVPKETEIAWGERRGDVHALAHAAIDAGADLVLGHGPHVLRAMEVYRGRLIAYSLGNFMGYKQFGTGGGPGGRTVALEAELAPNGVLLAAKLHPLALSSESIPAPDPAGAALADIRDLSKADFPETGVKVAPDGTLSW